MKKKNSILAVFILTFLFFLFPDSGKASLNRFCSPGSSQLPETALFNDGENALSAELAKKLQEIFEARATALLTGANPSWIEPFYEKLTRSGRWALAHEQTKISFVQNWAEKRGVRIVEARPTLYVKWSKIQKETAEFNLWQNLALGYQYPDQKEITNRFGIGTRHYLKLTKKDNRWVISHDWYTDPLGDDTLISKPIPAEGCADLKTGLKEAPAKKSTSDPCGTTLYDRTAAVSYADKYAGLAVIAGERKYNPRYRDLTHRGGDCTNFVSQVLGDKEGGKLPMDSVWYYRYDSDGGNGSTAWVRADCFVRWLLSGGRAIRVTKGNYSEVGQPTAEFPLSAVRELKEGDLIAYEEKLNIQHFAVITGHDSKGYPLVNAHTADRYHCPWDIGWDRATVFHLFHIRDT
ncbi:MAG: amidase domain-containing protein [Desulfotomaculales bacterium]